LGELARVDMAAAARLDQRSIERREAKRVLFDYCGNSLPFSLKPVYDM
jgi:hypothetical protein